MREAEGGRAGERARTRVKICGVTDPEQAATAAAGADAVGVVLVESKRRVSIERAREVLGAVPAYVTRVAVYRHPEAGLVRRSVEELDPDLHQSDAEDFEGALSLAGRGRRVAVVRVVDGFEARMERLLAAHADGSSRRTTVLVEGAASGSGERADWARVAAWTARCDVVLAGGLDPDNVAEAVSAVRPYGVDVSSGVERSAGVKDASLVRAFVEAVRAADEVSRRSTEERR